MKNLFAMGGLKFKYRLRGEAIDLMRVNVMLRFERELIVKIENRF